MTLIITRLQDVLSEICQGRSSVSVLLFHLFVLSFVNNKSQRVVPVVLIRSFWPMKIVGKRTQIIVDCRRKIIVVMVSICGCWFWREKNWENLPLDFVLGSDHSWLEWRVLWRRRERGRGGQTKRGQSGCQQQLCVRRRGDKDREVYHQIKTEQEEGQYSGC